MAVYQPRMVLIATACGQKLIRMHTFREVAGVHLYHESCVSMEEDRTCDDSRELALQPYLLISH